MPAVKQDTDSELYWLYDHMILVYNFLDWEKWYENYRQTVHEEHILYHRERDAWNLVMVHSDFTSDNQHRISSAGQVSLFQNTVSQLNDKLSGDNVNHLKALWLLVFCIIGPIQIQGQKFILVIFSKLFYNTWKMLFCIVFQLKLHKQEVPAVYAFMK